MTDKLCVKWSKREKALLYTGSKQTGGMLARFVEGVKMLDAYEMRHGLAARLHYPHESDDRTLAQELDARGYDLTTLKITISKKKSETP